MRQARWASAGGMAESGSGRARTVARLVSILLLGIAAPAAAGDRPLNALPSDRPARLRDADSAAPVRVVYFVPKDRQPVRRYRERITVLLTFAAERVRQELARHGYEVDGLGFPMVGERVAVQRMHGSQPARFYSGAPRYDAMRQWRRVLGEVDRRLGPARERLTLVFAETFDEPPAWAGDPADWPGALARGLSYPEGGGAVLFSAAILRDAFCAESVAKQLQRDRAVFGRAAGILARRLGDSLGVPPDDEAAESPEGALFSPAAAARLARSPFLARKPDGPNGG